VIALMLTAVMVGSACATPAPARRSSGANYRSEQASRMVERDFKQALATQPGPPPPAEPIEPERRDRQAELIDVPIRR